MKKTSAQYHHGRRTTSILSACVICLVALCIARTLLKHPKVMIFDDSTSAVDTATEAHIRRGLSSLGEMTKIIIAQRITSVMEADQIVILEDGRVHAVGTHESLLQTDSIYREIYDSQMRSSEDDGEQNREKGGA